jgi:hypothetical protein
MAAGAAESPSVIARIPTIGLGRDAAVAAFAQDKLGFLLHAARQYGPVVRLWPGVIPTPSPLGVSGLPEGYSPRVPCVL